MIITIKFLIEQGERGAVTHDAVPEVLLAQVQQLEKLAEKGASLARFRITGHKNSWNRREVYKITGSAEQTADSRERLHPRAQVAKGKLPFH